VRRLRAFAGWVIVLGVIGGPPVRGPSSLVEKVTVCILEKYTP
jgi:hypothetical protein